MQRSDLESSNSSQYIEKLHLQYKPRAKGQSPNDDFRNTRCIETPHYIKKVPFVIKGLMENDCDLAHGTTKLKSLNTKTEISSVSKTSIT